MTVDANAWVPDHQLDNISSLGFVNQLISETLDTYIGYIDGAGPIDLMPTRDKDREYVTVKAIKPIPTALTRRVAKVLEELRAVLEHVVMAEVEASLGRRMSSKEEKAVELPHLSSREALVNWATQKRRSTLPSLHEGQEMFERLETLQPYQRRTRPEDHPLRVLAELTNESKHRRPVKVGVLLGRAFSEDSHHHFEVEMQANQPLQPGAVLGSTPLAVQAVIAIYPNICIQLPHTGEWQNLVSLLRDLERWTRTIAVPTLITGSHLDLPTISAGIDVVTGFDDMRVAIAGADPRSAVEAGDEYIMLEAMKRHLPLLLQAMPSHLSPDVLEPFVASLSDEQVREITATTTSLRAEPHSLLAYSAEIEDAVRLHASR